VHYVVTNTGDAPVKMSFGWDDRGSPRPMRIRVMATGPGGTIVADPYPNPPNMGGIGSERELAKGEEFAFNVALPRYRRFEAPGHYAIAVAHDLGWDEGQRAAGFDPIPDDDDRWVRGTIKIVEPDLPTILTTTDTELVAQLDSDFDEDLALCERIERGDVVCRPWYRRLASSPLSLFRTEL